MIRLVFISTLAYNYFFPGKVNLAGGHTRIYHLSKAFASRPDYEVYCLTGDFGQPDQIEKDGVRLVKTPIDNPFAFLKVMLKLRQIKPDLIIDFCASPRLFLYYLLKKSDGLKYIFLTGCDNDVNGEYRKTENNLYNFFYMAGLRKADQIIAQVPHHKDLLNENWHMKSSLILSPYLDISRNEIEEKDIVLWVGRAAYYKGPELFVDLAARNQNHQFVMVCNRSGYDKGFAENLNQDGYIPENLEFHEYVPYPAMEALYKRAKLLINTSDYEGFPNTFIEAAVNHTPILSLNSNPNQMLSKHGAGFACNGSLELLNEKCRGLLLTDNRKLHEAGQKAYAYARKFHRLDRAVERFDQIFKSMVL